MPDAAGETTGYARSIIDIMIAPAVAAVTALGAWFSSVSKRLVRLETTVDAAEKRFEAFASENREQHAETKYALGEIHANLRQLGAGVNKLLEAQEGDQS